MKKSFLHSELTAFCALLCFSTATTHAAILIGNLPQANDGLNIGINNPAGFQVAVSFTLPVSQDYSVDSVVLRLSNYTTTGGDVAKIAFYTDNAGSPSSTQVGPDMTNPASASG